MSDWPAVLVLVKSRWSIMTFKPNSTPACCCVCRLVALTEKWADSLHFSKLAKTFCPSHTLMLLLLCFSDNYCNANNIFRTVTTFAAYVHNAQKINPTDSPNFPLAQATKSNMWLEMKRLNNYWMEKSASCFCNHFPTRHTLVYDQIPTFLCLVLISKHITTCDNKDVAMRTSAVHNLHDSEQASSDTKILLDAISHSVTCNEPARWLFRHGVLGPLM